MSLTTPTTQDISDNIVTQLEATLSQTVPLLPKAFIRVLAKALAGVFILLYKYCGFIFLQMFITSASFKPTTINGKTITPLIEWGRLVGAGEPKAATRAELEIDVTVESMTGTLPQGSQLLNSDTGVTYITLADVPLTSSTVQVDIRAVSDQEDNGGRGTIGNMTVGETLSFANPLPNVAREVEVASVITTAADGETEANYRTRVLNRFRQRPQGGALVDFAQWALTVEGIIGALPYTGDPGEVDIYCEATEASSGSADGIPTSAQLTAVEDAVNFNDDGLGSRRPLNSLVNALPITRTAFDVEVSGLSDAGLQTSIEDAVDEYFRGLAPFILGYSTLPRRDVIAKTALAGIVYTLVSNAGATFTDLTIEESGSPVTLRTLGDGEKAKAGSVTFV